MELQSSKKPASALIVGCGYLGRRVAAAWHGQGVSVTALTRSPRRAAEWQQGGWTGLVGDLARPEDLPDFPPVDVVLFAVGFDRSGGFSQEQVTVGGVETILARMANRCRRFLFISSSSVYGQQEGEWVDEESVTAPTQSGGVINRRAEAAVQQATSASMTGHVLRLSGIYGPGRLLSKVESLQRGEPLTGRGDAWLNLIHVADATAAVLAAAVHPSPPECILVSDNEPVLRRDYYGELARRIAAPGPVFDDTLPAKRGSGGVNKRCRNERLRTVLGVALRYPSYREGLADALSGSVSITPACDR